MSIASIKILYIEEMKPNLFLLFLFFSGVSLTAQDIDVAGKAKINTMEEDNNADKLVVRQSNGTLAVRDVSTLNELQVLSISNDTLFLSNGGFVKLPPDNVDDADADSTNELQTLSQVLAQDSSADNRRIKNIEDPIADQDAATKSYVDRLEKLVLLMNDVLLDEGFNGTLQDIDGNVYKTIQIGDQVWMEENLRTSRYSNGNLLVNGTGAGDISGDFTTKYMFDYQDNAVNTDTYGKLYTWAAVMNGGSSSSTSPSGMQGVCPTGWHLPSDTEWTELSTYLTNNGFGFEGNGDDIGKSLASASGWISVATAGRVGNDQGSNNSSGFTGLPGGNRNPSGSFSNIGSAGYWWSSTEASGSLAWQRSLINNLDYIERLGRNKSNGFSVRCMRD